MSFLTTASELRWSGPGVPCSSVRQRRGGGLGASGSEGGNKEVDRERLLR